MTFTVSRTPFTFTTILANMKLFQAAHTPDLLSNINCVPFVSGSMVQPSFDFVSFSFADLTQMSLVFKPTKSKVASTNSYQIRCTNAKFPDTNVTDADTPVV